MFSLNKSLNQAVTNRQLWYNFPYSSVPETFNIRLNKPLNARAVLISFANLYFICIHI